MLTHLQLMMVSLFLLLGLSQAQWGDCDTAGFRSCFFGVYHGDLMTNCQDDIDNTVLQSGCANRDGSNAGNCFIYTEALYDCFVDFDCNPAQLRTISVNRRGEDTSCKSPFHSYIYTQQRKLHSHTHTTATTIIINHKQTNII